MGTNVSTNYITCPADANKTLGIKLPFLVMIIKNVRYNNDNSKYNLNSWRSTSLSKSRFSMIRTLDADSALLTINRRPVWNLSSVPCRWDSMKAGTRSSSTCQISPVVPTEPTTLRPCAFKFTPIAESEEFTSPIASTPRTSFLPSSSSSCPSPARLRLENPLY